MSEKMCLDVLEYILMTEQHRDGQQVTQADRRREGQEQDDSWGMGTCEQVLQFHSIAKNEPKQEREKQEEWKSGAERRRQMDTEEWCGGCATHTWPRRPLPPLPEL